MYVMIGLMPLLALYIDVHFKKWAGLDFDLVSSKIIDRFYQLKIFALALSNS